MCVHARERGILAKPRARECLVFIRSFSAKETYNKWLFCKKWPAKITCKAKPKYRVAKTHRMPCRCFLQVIFRKRATKHRALWRKMTYKDNSSYDSTPPCISRTHFGHTFWLSQDISLTHSHILVETNTGLRRPIGCLKLQIIFRKRAINYRAFVRKMTCKDKAFFESAPPCISLTHLSHTLWSHILAKPKYPSHTLTHFG